MEFIYRRAYICGNCYLLFSKAWESEKGRPDCPACHTPASENGPCPTDSTYCAYHELYLQKENGPHFFADNYWFVASHCTEAEALRWREKYWEAPSLDCKHLQPKTPRHLEYQI